MKKFILTSSFTLLSLLLLASGNPKTTAVSGTITDKFGEPLAGAKVYIEDLKKSVYTDFEGNFSLKEIPKKEQKITISHVSYEQQSSSIDLSNSSSSFIHIELKSR